MKKSLAILTALVAGATTASAVVTLVGGSPIIPSASISLPTATTTEYASFADVQVGDVLVLIAASNRSIEQVTFTYKHTLTIGGTATVSAATNINTEQINPQLAGQSWVWYVTVESIAGGTDVTFSLSHDGAATSSIHHTAFHLREDQGLPIWVAKTFTFKDAVAELITPFSMDFIKTVPQGIGVLAVSARDGATITTPASVNAPNSIEDAGWVRTIGTSARGMYYDMTSISGDSEQFSFELDVVGTLVMAGVVFASDAIPQALWATYPITNDQGDVDTLGWMGWINVSAGDWVWSYSTMGWVYLPEDMVAPGGAWAYFLK